MIRASRFIVIVALVLGTSFAGAAPKKVDPKADAAEVLIQEGIKLRRVGRDDAALEKFERAFGISPTPRAAAQKGLCLQALGRFTEAEGYLAQSLEGAADPWVSKNRGTIKDSIEQVKTKIGRFEISGSPIGAHVTVDGREVGQFPLSGMVRINEGAAVLEVQADGYVSERTSLQVQGASFRQLEFRLKKEATVAVAPMPQNPANIESNEALSASANDAASDAPVYKKAWFWGAVGAVVVGGAVAAFLLSGGKEVTSPNVNDTAAL
jgi:tetratricopeptide (TPR) repeat protein